MCFRLKSLTLDNAVISKELVLEELPARDSVFGSHLPIS